MCWNMHRANQIKHILKKILRSGLKIKHSCMWTPSILSDICIYSYWSSFYMLEEVIRYHSHKMSKEKKNGREKMKIEGKRQRSLQAS